MRYGVLMLAAVALSWAAATRSMSMNIVKATRHFEQWLGRRTALVEPDLRLKHQRMAEVPFAFFRATFYRWMQMKPQRIFGVAALDATARRR